MNLDRYFFNFADEEPVQLKRFGFLNLLNLWNFI